jgi:hypothetical protein
MCEQLLKDDEGRAKANRVDRMTADGLVCHSPSMLYSVIVSNSAGGASLAKVFDGESTSADQKMDIDMLSSTTFQYNFDPPVFMARGIYIVIGTNTSSVMVVHRPMRG